MDHCTENDCYEDFEFELQGGAEFYIYKYFAAMGKRKNNLKIPTASPMMQNESINWSDILLPLKLCIKAKFGPMAFFGNEWLYA